MRLLVWFSVFCLALAGAFWMTPDFFLGLVRAGGGSQQLLPAAGYLAAIGVFAAVSEHRALRA